MERTRPRNLRGFSWRGGRARPGVPGQRWAAEDPWACRGASWAGGKEQTTAVRKAGVTGMSSGPAGRERDSQRQSPRAWSEEGARGTCRWLLAQEHGCSGGWPSAWEGMQGGAHLRRERPCLVEKPGCKHAKRETRGMGIRS